MSAHNRHNKLVHDHAKAAAGALTQKKARSTPVEKTFPDNRTETAQLQTLQDLMKTKSDFPVQKKANKTGLPDNLKSGIENLSRHSLDDVKVHYNSSKPAQLNAHAFAQGTQIHIAPGQERHLAHEAWHVVQQKQGRVRPTKQLKSAVPVNDDPALEKEADVMGAKAMQMKFMHGAASGSFATAERRGAGVFQLASPLRNNVLNVVGENHPETEARLAREKLYTAAHAGSANYWTEEKFRVRAYKFSTDWFHDKRAFADPFEQRFNHSQKFMQGNAAIIRGDANAARNDADAWDHLNSERKFIHNLWVYLSNLSSGLLTDQTDGFEVPEARRQEMLGYKQQVKNIAATWQSARVDLAAAMHRPAPAVVFDWSAGGVAVAGGGNYGARYKQSVDALADLNIVNETADDISRNRSAAMHVAANARHAELGVWKIGEAHRGHMAAEAHINYNLVSRAAFNADYNTWNP